MAGIVQMLHALQPPYDNYYHMPTQREYESSNPEIKDEHKPATRLRFLDRMPGEWKPIVHSSLSYSIVLHILAIVGIIYLLS